MMEENAQMSLLPDAVGATQMTMTGEEEIDLSEYEIVRPEFFAHIKEPALTVNVDKIGVSTACVRLMPDVEYVQILVNRKEKKLLLKPCDEIEITGYRWGKTKEGKRYPTQRMNCTPFVRQYGILSNKWGVFLCQKEYQTNDIRRNSKNW